MDNTNSTEQVLGKFIGTLFQRRNLWLGAILVSALIGFEAFNYSTTFTALNDLLGDMRFAGIRWATILALAFSSIDFAGIARMFTDDQAEPAGREVWFLFIAWLLAATLNATLTWWGVSLALVNHQMMSTNMVDPGVLMRAVPIFVAVMVWVTRILLISAISSTGSRFAPVEEQPAAQNDRALAVAQHSSVAARPRQAQIENPAPRPTAARPASTTNRPATTATRPAVNQPASQRPLPQRPPVTQAPRRPEEGKTANSPASAPRPNATRPQNHPRPNTQPPMPQPPPVEDDDLFDSIDEPEYIPDPTYVPAFHSLSARGDKGNTAPRR